MFTNNVIHKFNAFVDLSVRMSRTRANYWAEFALDILLSMTLMIWGITTDGVTLKFVLPTFGAGLILFSFIEYFFHRWIFHQGNSVMAKGHAAHHLNPLGYDALPFYLPTLVFTGLALMFAVVLPWAYSAILTASIITGYILYGASHFTIHHHRFQLFILRRWSASHHIHHTHPDKNFGVTSPLWDILLGTRYISRQTKR